MTDKPQLDKPDNLTDSAVEAASEELQTTVTRLKGSLAELDEVLATLLKTFEEKGIKPGQFLDTARKRVNRRVEQLEAASSRVAGQLANLNELVRTTSLITSTLEVDEVLEDVLDTIVGLTGAERSYLMLYDENRKLEVRAARNWDQKSLKETEVGLSKSVVDKAVEEGTPIITTNAQADKRFSAQESIVIQKLRSIICVPLTLGGTAVGVLYADNRFTQGAFTDDMIPILTAFGTQAAIAITNARNFQMVRQNLTKAQEVIDQLRIEVDQKQVNRQVEQITSSGYFQELADAARALREARKRGETGRVYPPPSEADKKQ